MHKLNPRTAALLSAFGWAVGYLLAGKALAVLLPAPPGGAARLFRVCLLAPLAEEGMFRGAVQRRAQPLGRRQAILLQAVLFVLYGVLRNLPFAPFSALAPTYVA